MKKPKRHTAYVSFSPESHGLLALWVDHRPSGDKDQTDPDGWVSGVDQATDYVIERLCELSKVPGAEVVRCNAYAAEWWDKIERARKTAATKARRAATAGAQAMFAIDPEIEAEGRRVGAARTWNKKSVKKAS